MLGHIVELWSINLCGYDWYSSFEPERKGVGDRIPALIVQVALKVTICIMVETH